MGELSVEQRWLLSVYPPNMVADLVADPDYGIDRIRSTCAGGTWPRGARDDVPDWLGHYSTSGGVIVGGPAPGLEPMASIKLGQLRRWAEGLPARLRREMRETLAAERAENRRSAGWCRCPHTESPPAPRGGRCRRKHPGDVIWEEHYRRQRELWERRDALLREAIWEISEAADPDQMALFEVSVRAGDKTGQPAPAVDDLGVFPRGSVANDGEHGPAGVNGGGGVGEFLHAARSESSQPQRDLEAALLRARVRMWEAVDD